MKEDKHFKFFTRNLYLYSFLSQFVFVYAIYTILFKEKGLSLLEISILLALWSFFVVIFEIPTGALADRWNRKYMLSLSLVFKALCFGIWLLADNFFLFALGFLFWSMEETFASGTLESLIFDTLKKHKKTDDYEKIAGRVGFYRKIAVGLSTFLGSILASYSFNLTILLSSCVMILSILPTLFLREIKFNKTSTQETRYLRLIKNAFGEVVKNRLLLKLILYFLIVIGIAGDLDEYEYLYFDWLNIKIVYFGTLGIIIMLANALGSRIAYRFKKYFKNNNNIYIISLIVGIFLILSVLTKSLIILPVYIFAFFLIAISGTYVEASLQREIKIDARATITSINSLVLNLSGIILLLFFGFLSKFGGIAYGFYGFGFLMILFSIVSIILNKKQRKASLNQG